MPNALATFFNINFEGISLLWRLQVARVSNVLLQQYLAVSYLFISTFRVNELRKLWTSQYLDDRNPQLYLALSGVNLLAIPQLLATFPPAWGIYTYFITVFLFYVHILVTLPLFCLSSTSFLLHRCRSSSIAHLNLPSLWHSAASFDSDTASKSVGINCTRYLWTIHTYTDVYVYIFIMLIKYTFSSL